MKKHYYSFVFLASTCANSMEMQMKTYQQKQQASQSELALPSGALPYIITPIPTFVPLDPSNTNYAFQLLTMLRAQQQSIVKTIDSSDLEADIVYQQLDDCGAVELTVNNISKTFAFAGTLRKVELTNTNILKITTHIQYQEFALNQMSSKIFEYVIADPNQFLLAVSDDSKFILRWTMQTQKMEFVERETNRVVDQNSTTYISITDAVIKYDNSRYAIQKLAANHMQGINIWYMGPDRVWNLYEQGKSGTYIELDTAFDIQFLANGIKDSENRAYNEQGQPITIYTSPDFPG